MLITFCVCRSILMSLATTKWKIAHRRQVLLFQWSHMLQLVLVQLFFSLLILYAEAAWLSTVKTALHKLRAPWGICVELNLKARLFSFCFFVLQMGGGSDKMLQSIRRSRVLLGSAAGSNRIHFSATPSSSSPITAPLRACNALIQRWSLLQ